MSMLLAIDFDGTLATHDTVDWFSARWAPEDFEAADEALALTFARKPRPSGTFSIVLTR